MTMTFIAGVFIGTVWVFAAVGYLVVSDEYWGR